MNLLAKSCFAPGLIALISNLIATAGEINTDIVDEDWFEEYAEGMGHEIYRMPIDKGDYPDNISFKKISEIAYSEYQAVVFALEIQSKQLPVQSIIRLNPTNFILKDWNSFNFYLYIICEDDQVAKNIEKLIMLEERYERIFNRPRMKKDEQ